MSTSTSGSITTATYAFYLTDEQLRNLECVSPFLEIDFHLEGLWVPWQWDNYVVHNTNLPGALHDVAAGDFASSTPGVTRIRVADLDPWKHYKLTLMWTTLPAQPGRTPGFWVAWIPSRWAEGPYEVPFCALVPIDWRGEAWCIFPYLDAVAYFDRPMTGVNQLNFGDAHVLGWGDWLNNRIPPDIQMLPTLSSTFSLAPLLPAITSRQMFLRGDSAVFAKDHLDNGGWTQETDPASIKAISAGGRYQMVLNACNAVYAKDTLGMGGWVQETPCGGATKIAMSVTGLQMVIDACGAVHAKYGIGMGGWTREVDCGNADAIAVGGNTQMFLRGDKAVFARTGVGEGWQMQAGPANAIAIAADNTGMQAFLRWDGAVFAKRNHFGDGGWQMQVGPGNADAVATGGGIIAFLRGDGAVFAKRDISLDGGWLQQADPGTVTGIAMGNNGRMMVKSNTNAIYAKDNLVNGDWKLQVGDGNAEAIAVG